METVTGPAVQDETSPYGSAAGRSKAMFAALPITRLPGARAHGVMFCRPPMVTIRHRRQSKQPARKSGASRQKDSD